MDKLSTNSPWRRDALAWEGARVHIRELAWIPVLLALGCQRYTTNRIPVGPLPQRGATSVGQIELILGEPPAEPRTDFEILEADSARGGTFVPDTPRVMQMLKEAAAEDGADGVHSVKCGAPGTVGEGKCTGIAFVYKR